jgi:hypothetical protein
MSFEILGGTWRRGSDERAQRSAWPNPGPRVIGFIPASGRVLAHVFELAPICGRVQNGLVPFEGSVGRAIRLPSCGDDELSGVWPQAIPQRAEIGGENIGPVGYNVTHDPHIFIPPMP